MSARLSSLCLVLVLAACGGGGPNSGDDTPAPTPPPVPTPPPTPTPPPAPTPKPGGRFLFVGQVPLPSGESDIGTVTGTFSTHLPRISAAPRGGSLYLREADGTLRDLLDEALRNGCADADPTTLCDSGGARMLGALDTDGDGTEDALGLVRGRAVRDPVVHFDGDRVLFSLVDGAIRRRFRPLEPEASPRWQLHQISDLRPGGTPLLRKVPNQPPYNNVHPAYGPDERIVFASDRPITGDDRHYPQLEEYESGPTVSGLWKMDPAGGPLELLDHSPSGLFTPILDSFGQVVYIRWDHLQQDQQALNAVDAVIKGEADSFDAYTYAHEDESGPAAYTRVRDLVTAALTAGDDATAYAAAEVAIPEYHNAHPVWTARPDRVGQTVGAFGGQPIRAYTPVNEYGRIGDLRFNLFLPWRVDYDSTDGVRHETLCHFGRQEVLHFLETSYRDDPALRELNAERLMLDGMFHITEDPGAPGRYYVAVAPEFHTHAAGYLLRIDAPDCSRSEDGGALEFTLLTRRDAMADGLWRNPLMFSDGTLAASFDEIPAADKDPAQRTPYEFRFRLRATTGAEGELRPGAHLLDAPIHVDFRWLEESGATRHYAGPLWELTPVEVRARPRPVGVRTPPPEAPEAAAFAAAGVDLATFRTWLRARDLALIVSRDVTTRDEADRQQPFNLRVDCDAGPCRQTVGDPAGRVYPIKWLQLAQNDLVRGYAKYASGSGAEFHDNGRRGLARWLHDAAALDANGMPVAGAPPGGVPIAADGSVAAFVPAGRAVTWMLGDADGTPIVRERYWLKFAPGEVRVCASCHGINDRGQDGAGKPGNTPQALTELLARWQAEVGH